MAMADCAQQRQLHKQDLQDGSFELISRKQFIIDTELQKEKFDIQTFLEGKDDTDAIKAALYCGKPGPVVSIPIKRLAHVTHTKDAEEITNESLSNKCTFIPQRKCGKAYKGKAPGSCVPKQDESGVTVYDRILPAECVFCGEESCQCKFSWWGIDISDWYYKEKGEGERFAQAVKDLQTRHNAYAALFLQNPPESYYGTNAFRISFTTLIKQYEESRVGSKGGACFRVGGTLQYSQEIAYVVLVCMKSDQDLEEYPSIDSNNEKFSHQGLNQGEIQDICQTPTFNTRYFVTYMKENKTAYKYCWENLVFALYLPNGENLNCNASLTSKVPHPVDFCHKKLGASEVCPDKDVLQAQLCKKCTYPKKLFCLRHKQ